MRQDPFMTRPTVTSVWPVLAVALLAVFGISTAYRSKTATKPVMTRSVSTVGSDNSRVFAVGRIEGSRPNVELRFQVAGCVDQVLVTEGEMVSSEQTLLRLDDREFRQEVSLAAAGVRLAQAEYERLQNGARPQERREAQSLYEAKLAEMKNAQMIWDRIRQLRAENAIAQQEADNRLAQLTTLEAEVAAAKARVDLVQAPAREDELQMAAARVDAAQARLELAKIQLDRMHLKSPINGLVLEVNLEAGELTGPESVDAAVVIAETSRTRVRAFVEELDAARVHVGMPAIVVADGLPGRQFEGRVVRMSPHMSRKRLWTDRPAERFDTKVRQLWIELEDASELVLGLRVDVTIEATGTEPIAPKLSLVRPPMHGQTRVGGHESVLQ